MKFYEVLKIMRDALSEGKQIRALRRNWNGVRIGQRMWIYIEPGKVLRGLREPLKSWLRIDEAYDTDDKIDVLPHFNLVIGNKLVSGWLASQTDLLADDWEIIE
jgi:hypothetical protein